ncbi:unnamed protein product [Allacma fusca]|uniref:BPTI/Kunitz inhibitor domain-containing protein n=1 Tax=Allacma fusca TaxID=39272 RepID=A0A8J2JHM0_9HEXA|nr:unnamed protein product [Allacma fusca]
MDSTFVDFTENVDPNMHDGTIRYQATIFPESTVTDTSTGIKEIIRDTKLYNSSTFTEYHEQVIEKEIGPKSEETIWETRKFANNPFELQSAKKHSMGRNEATLKIESESTNSKVGACEEHLDVGNCNQTVLRFFWNGKDCLPFNYTGCSGNNNRFSSEHECQQACSDSFEDTSKKLFCIFGTNFFVPFGKSLQDNELCGAHFCTCTIPPSLTCTVSPCH